MATPSSTAELAEMLGRELAAAGSRFSWQLQGLRDGVAAYCFGRLAEKLVRPVLIVAPTASVAEGFALDLRTVLGEREDADFLTRRVHLFPERDAPTFEMVSPSLEVEAARAAAAYQLGTATAPIVVASVAALTQRTPPRDSLLESVVYVMPDSELDVEAFPASSG